MKVNGRWINKNIQHFDSTQMVDLNLLLKPLGGIESDVNGLYIQELNKKPLVLLENTNNITLSGSQTLDGIVAPDNTRVGVFNQTTGSEDGFYITNDSGAWTRTGDMPAGYATSGVTFEVLGGLSNINTTWVVKSPIGSDIINTHDIQLTQTYSQANVQWQFTGTDRLQPINPAVEGVEIENNHNGYTWLTLRNTENSGNAAGSVVELHKSNTAYQDNVYFGLYGDSYWLPFLAGNGALITDQNLVIGTVDNTKEIRIITGDSYFAPVQVAKFDTNGLSIESLKSTSVNPSNFSNVMVNTDTGLLYANSDIISGSNKQTDTFTLTALDIANGYITLSETINTSKHEIVNYNGAILFEGAAEDYTVDTVNNRVLFTASQLTNLYVGAKIQVKYYY